MDGNQRLRESVRGAYSAAAERPGARHPFPVGRRFAEQVGYPRERLDALPAVAVEAFAGVSSVALVAPLPPGARVVDLGCGAGLDTLIAAERVGSHGWVVGVDFSDSMLERARSAVAAMRLSTVELLRASAERLPLDDSSIDVALVNGLLNLQPARHSVLEELGRVLRPGGTLFAAELILTESLPGTEATDANWFA